MDKLHTDLQSPGSDVGVARLSTMSPSEADAIRPSGMSNRILETERMRNVHEIALVFQMDMLLNEKL